MKWQKLYPKECTFKARYEDRGFMFYDNLSEVKSVATKETPIVLWICDESFRTVSVDWFHKHCTGTVEAGGYYSECRFITDVGFWVAKTRSGNYLISDDMENGKIEVIGEELFRRWFVC